MKNHRFIFLFACLLLLFSSVISCQDEPPYQFIEPADANVSIMGRTLTDENGHIQFDWPGVTIHATFTGSYCAIKLDDAGRNLYNVFLNDAPVRIIDVSSDTTIILGDDLGTGTHNIMITKRTEGNLGRATFKGLIIHENGTLLDPPLPAERKIEFIGNSITCGYGTDSDDRFERFTPETENNYHSFAPITARAFSADYHIVAHSGQGIVRNYGYEEPVSPYTMQQRYLQTFDMEMEPAWDFSRWQPDMVVINLGTNDFSTQPHPNETVFNKGYNNLVGNVRKNYGDIPIFCIVGPMIDEPCYSYVKNMVEGNRNSLNDENIYFIGIPNALMILDEDLGADWHPNYSGQKKMAAHIAPVIASVMGWDYGEIH